MPDGHPEPTRTTHADHPHGPGCVALFIALFLVGFTAILAVVNTISIDGLIAQRDASRFVETRAIIDEASVHRSADGGDFLRLEYRYAVRAADGRERQLTGDRYSFAGAHLFTDDAKRDAAQRLRSASDVPAWYDPDEPERVVLERRLLPGDFAIALALLPFNLVAALGWTFLAIELRVMLAKPRFGGLTIRRSPNETRLRKPGTRPVYFAFAAAILASAGGLIGFFALLATRMTTPEPVFVIVGVVVLVGLIVWVGARRRAASPRRTITIDHLRHQITLPAADPGAPSRTIDVADIERVEARTVDASRAHKRRAERTLVELHVRDPGGTHRRENATPERVEALRSMSQLVGHLAARDLANALGVAGPEAQPDHAPA